MKTPTNPYEFEEKNYISFDKNKEFLPIMEREERRETPSNQLATTLNLLCQIKYNCDEG